MSLQEELRQYAKSLLESGQVDLVIGYEDSGEPMVTTPCFIKDAGDTDRLVWNAFCDNNLVKYLIGRKEKIAIVVKGCDSRSLVVLINENQVDRDKVKIIGVSCGGIVDRKKIEMHFGNREIREAVIEGDIIHIKGDGFEEDLKISDYLCQCCQVCNQHTAVISDKLIGEKINETSDTEAYGIIKEFESKSSTERWDYIKKELSKCIRCYACREACPLCYCKSCFVDQSFPAWFGKSTDISDTIAFHLARALHTTGRCVDCGACSRACPNGIDLRLLTKKIEKDVAELFGDHAGMELDKKATLTDYKKDDPQDFIK